MIRVSKRGSDVAQFRGPILAGERPAGRKIIDHTVRSDCLDEAAGLDSFRSLDEARNLLGHSHRDYFVSVSAVDSKIGVQGEDFCRGMHLRKTDQTGIGQRHGPVAKAAYERAQV